MMKRFIFNTQRERMDEHEDGDFVLFNELEAQLAERDKTLLEQQARITKAIEILLWGETRLGSSAYELLTSDNSLSALEAALKAERIKTLEDAIEEMIYSECIGSLRRMVNELKEQSCQ